jgi:hypothetical protein
MAEKLNWKDIWEKSLNDKELFPINSVDKDTVSVSCPTRFSNTGKIAIEITPSFNDDSITLELLVFNDNVSIDDIKDIEVDGSGDKYSQLAAKLIDYELSNRIMERFKISSDGFESEDEAENTLVDYINNKATESGRMFDDKLDELNDTISTKEEKLDRLLESIRCNRSFIIKKIESILNSHYGWKAQKNEDYMDSTASLYDTNGNLAAVVSLVDDFVVVDLAKGISAKVSMIQSDEDIESELTDDVDNAQAIISNREIEQLKDAISDEDEDLDIDEDIFDTEDEDYFESLSRRVTKLENLYIRKRLNRVH